jgi:hypothetical protein
LVRRRPRQTGSAKTQEAGIRSLPAAIPLQEETNTVREETAKAKTFKP